MECDGVREISSRDLGGLRRDRTRSGDPLRNTACLLPSDDGQNTRQSLYPPCASFIPSTTTCARWPAGRTRVPRPDGLCSPDLDGPRPRWSRPRWSLTWMVPDLDGPRPGWWSPTWMVPDLDGPRPDGRRRRPAGRARAGLLAALLAYWPRHAPLWYATRSSASCSACISSCLPPSERKG